MARVKAREKGERGVVKTTPQRDPTKRNAEIGQFQRPALQEKDPAVCLQRGFFDALIATVGPLSAASHFLQGGV